MPSPFPGIDPYLEGQDLWPDFHARFIPALCDAISEQLPESYVARIDERGNEESREIYIEILHRPDQNVVTVVESLSPSNKGENSRRDYLTKRNGLMVQEVHLVELDFLVGGHRPPMEQPLPPGDFYALIARADRRPDCDVFAWSVRDPLPTIPVPLLAPDPDLMIDLAPLFASVYNRARYSRSINYRAPLTVPLAPGDRDWAEGRARASAR